MINMLFVRVLFFIVVFICTCYSQYAVPSVTLEALKKGGFRVYIPDVPGTALFAFHANINDNIRPQHPGSVNAETKTSENGFWILEFDNQLKVGDVVNYWIFVNANHLGYRKDGDPWKVQRLLDSYTTLRSRCVTGSTVMNGGKSTCIGDSLINDDYTGPFVDSNTWTVEHRIPTYVGPNFYFNSFVNADDTRFIRDKVLYLKPIALSDADVRGTLNLRQGCTATDNFECFYESKSSFLLPPVKSAKVVSKTTFKYGKIEIRAKLPEGDWIVPILQLEPAQTDTVSPANIIVAYSRGNKALSWSDPLLDVRSMGNKDIGSRLLLGGPTLSSGDPEGRRRLVSTYQNNPLNEGFHIYSLEWTPDRMKCFLDGNEYGSVDLRNTPNLFDQEYVLAIGVAVGGINDFPDEINSGNEPKPWSNTDRNYIKRFFEGKPVWSKTWDGDSSALQVDYVKGPLRRIGRSVLVIKFLIKGRLNHNIQLTTIDPLNVMIGKSNSVRRKEHRMCHL
ncbi:hypothetical protein RN001_009197 [Aquatica leii]|uniref:Uncharacterized protein n=1 Tax=Aquatica leii TaxID=1421715 RepID=A0AAN7S820_9COLE|nr:hypothetical protein RN001_009197 [Aquatica leii]